MVRMVMGIKPIGSPNRCFEWYASALINDMPLPPRCYTVSCSVTFLFQTSLPASAKLIQENPYLTTVL